MQYKPHNLTWWDERSDVDSFYQSMDLFLFTSRGSKNDKETMPLVIREALSYQIPQLLYNLEVYQNYFNDYDLKRMFLTVCLLLKTLLNAKKLNLRQ